MSTEDRRYEEAVAKFFAIHATDPRTVDRDGRSLPWSVLYHERMRDWLRKLAPDASLALRLAVCCQHISRWEIPRDRYPEGKLGYKRWRHDLAVFHGEKAASVLQDAGFQEETIQRVKELLLKTNLKADPEAQMMEDVVCLVFLENEFAAFAEKHDEEKLGVILRKTWKKMSPQGHEQALGLVAGLPENLRELVGRSLAPIN